MLRVAIRADASAQIGTGHIMRCLALANVLRARGGQVRIISRHLPEYLHNMLTEQGHEVVLIGASQGDSGLDELAHSSWLGVSQEQDAADSILALADGGCDWVVVDHYALDFRWESKLRQVANGILAIDDIADRQHDCDILLDQNFYADMEGRYAGKVPESTQLLLGPRYALLRDEFGAMHEKVQPRNGAVRRILIFFGGVDAENYTGRSVTALSELGLVGIRLDVVIGAQHPCREQVEAECAKQGYSCHVQTSRMAQLMAAADMAIGAGGSAVWERCCLGVPALLFCTASNQEKQLADAADAGIIYVPERDGDLSQAIQRHVTALLGNRHLRYLISKNGMRMVNGRGADEVAARIGCEDIELRAVNMGDSERLFNWRNHPSVRVVSRSDKEIAWDEHQKWIAAALADPKKVLLIGEQAGTPIGVVRFDMVNGGDAEVSIYLDPEKQSSGYGSRLLRRAERWLQTHHPEIVAISALVMGGNERSHRLFASAGYAVQTATYWKRLH